LQNDGQMRTLVAVTLAASALLQLIAALLALRALPGSRSHRYPWIALSLALVLMVERRIEPLLDFHDSMADLADALYALLVSAVIVLSVIGLVRLLRELRATEERLTHLSVTDPLTGLANRRHLLAGLEQELRRADRSGRPLSVLMVDLDHFKAINDRYGHAVGDAVLVAVAARCQARLRAIDLCGRVGGEEFVVVLPETDAEGAAATAERLRADLADAPIDTAKGRLSLTISVGTVTYDPAVPFADHAPGDTVVATVHVLLQRADDALYRAKESGRNCVRADDRDAPASVPDRKSA
jgi:diguanylate cyclase (GGDEF)-like protein